MLIKQNEVDEHKLGGICETLGVEELLGQLTEECGELVQEQHWRLASHGQNLGGCAQCELVRHGENGRCGRVYSGID